MGRKRKGRDIHGWLVVDKPAGLTSTAVVNKVRWAFDAKKAGHAGTLDPEATGVLAVALGEATKTVPYITDALKAYEFTVTFGAKTNTDDAEGEVIQTTSPTLILSDQCSSYSPLLCSRSERRYDSYHRSRYFSNNSSRLLRVETRFS